MNGMKLQPTSWGGLCVIETMPIVDARGRFVRVFCEDELAALRPGLHFPQINLSTSFARGTVRGMHFQRPPAAEAKLIRCLRGRVFDVAVDVRAGSSTFLKWQAIELDADSPRQIFIPEGFAHGFQALTDDVQLLYMHTSRWNADYECSLRHDDPALAITWPLPVTQVSGKDRLAPLLDAAFAGVAS
ncbi:MAG: dTDP-4-dehydrorhamnose 3,5-epimerase [Dokdonella sp.]